MKGAPGTVQSTTHGGHAHDHNQRERQREDRASAQARVRQPEDHLEEHRPARREQKHQKPAGEQHDHREKRQNVHALAPRPAAARRKKPNRRGSWSKTVLDSRGMRAIARRRRLIAQLQHGGRRRRRRSS
jgi:hypothetical protein